MYFYALTKRKSPLLTVGRFFRGSQMLGTKRPNGGKQSSVDVFQVQLGMGLGQRCIMKGGV